MTTAEADGLPQEHFYAYAADELIAVLSADFFSSPLPANYDVVTLAGEKAGQHVHQLSKLASASGAAIVSNRAGHCCDLRLAPALSIGEAAAVTGGLIRAIEEEADRRGQPYIVFHGVSVNSAILERELAAHGYVPAVTDANAYLPVHFTSFDDYRRSISSRNRRKTIGRERRTFTEEGFGSQVVSVPEGLDRFVHLAESNFAKYDNAFNADTYASRVSAMAANFGSDVMLVELLRGGNVMGSMLALREGKELHPRTIGLSEEIPKRVAPYFNLAYYSCIETAIDLEINTIVYGNELYETKISRGCLLETTRSWIKASADSQLQPELAQLWQDADGAGQQAIERLLGDTDSTAAAPDW